MLLLERRFQDEVAVGFYIDNSSGDSRGEAILPIVFAFGLVLVIEIKLEARFAMPQLGLAQAVIFVEPEPFAEFSTRVPRLLGFKFGVRLVFFVLADDDGDQILDLELSRNLGGNRVERCAFDSPRWCRARVDSLRSRSAENADR